MKITFSKSILSSLTIAAILSSCTNSVTVFPARQAEVQTSKIITPIKIVDYDADLNKKVEGTAEGYLTKGSNLEYYKEQAIINACSAVTADFLINPTFTVSTNANKVTVKVNGYPAKYTEVRNAEPADSIHLKYSGGYNYVAPPSGRSRLKMIY